VDGVPEDYHAASRKLVPNAELAGREAGVHALYERMAVISFEPDWAKLLDFETTIPAVAKLVAAPGDSR
jgi:hypothetical protein